jgi:hypothetical protein
MVSIGKCKRFVMTEDAGPNPYLTEEARVEAFWQALLTGQTSQPDFPELEDGPSSFKYQDWLPLVPSLWTPSSPPLLPISSGRALAASFNAHIFGPVATNLGPDRVAVSLPGVGL